LKDSYGKLLKLSRQVRRQANKTLEELKAQNLKAEAANLLSVLVAEAQLRHYLPLVDKVIAQTQARIFEGQTRYEDKILSLFEEHSAIIRKGKPDKPTEFGRLVRLDEVENGIISGYVIAEGNPADQQQWVPALEHHREMFGQVPVLAAADRGFWSSENEQAALDMGIKRVVVAHTAVRKGVEAWARIQACLRQLGIANKEQVIPSKPRSRRKNTVSQKPHFCNSL
jgi:IS5 family transposase